MALAYQILGFKPHHGLLEKVTGKPWTQLEQTAEATWPNVPGARRILLAPPVGVSWHRQLEKRLSLIRLPSGGTTHLPTY
jgi:hypothetical protein